MERFWHCKFIDNQGYQLKTESEWIIRLQSDGNDFINVLAETAKCKEIIRTQLGEETFDEIINDGNEFDAEVVEFCENGVAEL